MAKKQILTKLKSLWILSVICIICLSLFFITACGDEKTEDYDDSKVTKIESDEALIKNGSFEFGSSELAFSDFPQTSAKNWTKAYDNSARSSSFDSGIISVSEKGWKGTMEKLFQDSDVYKYVEKQFDAIHSPDTFKDKVVDVVSSANPTIKDTTSKDFKIKVADKMVDDNLLEGIFDNPGVHSSVADNDSKVYMLNNYGHVGDEFLGTAQKVTSSTSLSLKKGEYAKISFCVNTQNIENTNEESFGGANFRVIPTVNGVAQKTYAVYNMRTDGDWEQHTVLIKADENIDCSLTIAFGLGFGKYLSNQTDNFVKGTVFFDNIVFETVDKDAYDEVANGNDPYQSSFVSTASSDYEYVNGCSVFDTCLDLSLPTDFLGTALDCRNFTVDYSKNASDESCADYLDTCSFNHGASENNVNVTIESASVTLTMENVITLKPEEYAIISFDAKAELGEFDTNGISFFVKAQDGTLNSASKLSDKEGKIFILVKNALTEKHYEQTETQTFDLIIVIGPTAFTSVSKATDFSTGVVNISNLKIASGKTYQYERDFVSGTTGNYTSLSTQTENYDYYTIYSKIALSTVSLSAGYTSVEQDSNPSYSFKIASSDVGTIVDFPASPADYFGVTPDSIYVKEQATAYDVNAKCGLDGTAGVINTKYSYASLAGLEDAIGYHKDDIQPLVILTDNEAYGFIGEKISISASTYKTISVDVKVCDGAKANIYLVDLSNNNKDVATFTVSENSDGYSKIATKQSVTKDFAISIDDATDGWKTVSFYIATGDNDKQFRLELWNGSRDGAIKTTGYIFFDNVSTSGSFSEPANVAEAFTTSGILFNAKLEDSSIEDNALYHVRELDAEQIAYNKEHSDNLISYNSKIVWANNENTIYAIYNTIEPIKDDVPSDEEKTPAGCEATSNPSAFWLSFSSILLAAVLVLAIVALIIKNVAIKAKANKNDVKSHYKVTSKISSHRKNQKAKKEKEDLNDADEEAEVKDIVDSSFVDEDIKAEDENKEEQNTSDEYVYGEVTDFSAEEKTEEKTEEKAEEPAKEVTEENVEQPVESEQPSEEKPE